MKKVTILILVGTILSLSSQTLFKDNYLKSQNILNSYRWVSGGVSTDSLLVHYAFQNSFNDTSGNGYNLTATNPSNLTFVNDSNGNALSALQIESTGYLRNTDYKVYLTSYTVSFWIHANANPGRIVGVFSQSGPPTTGTLIDIYNGTMRIRISDDVGATALLSKTGIITDKWYHVLFQRDADDSGKLYIYIDNVLFNDSYNLTGNLIDTWFWQLGNATGDYGIIDDFRIYKRFLTSDERTYLFNNIE